MSTRVLLVGLLLLAVAGVAGGWWYAEHGPEVHVIERGDTLSKLAHRYGVTVDELRRWNGIDGDLIEVGDRLWVWPERAPEPAGPSDEPAPRARARPHRALPPPPPAGEQDFPPLVRPTPKRCLAAPDSEDLAHEEMVASEGLTHEAASRALSAFAPTLSRCTAHSSEIPGGTLELDIRVACTGVVDDVAIRDMGDWPPEVARCMADTLRYAAFPAHGLPDGDLVIYPLRYR